MKTASKVADLESQRCEYLHRLCRQIEGMIEAGQPAKTAIGRAARRQNQRLFKHGRLSLGRLTVLFYAWRKSRSPEVFRRNYQPGKPRVPFELIEEFLNRLQADKVVSVSAVIQSLRSDWRMGRSIPGLGTWQQYVRRHKGTDCIRISAPRFPISVRTLFRVLEGQRPGEYRRRIKAALQAEAELVRYARFLEENRQRINRRLRHELIGGREAIAS